MAPVWVEEKTLVSKAGLGALQFKETKPTLTKRASAALPVREATASSCGIETTTSKACLGYFGFFFQALNCFK